MRSRNSAPFMSLVTAAMCVLMYCAPFANLSAQSQVSDGMPTDAEVAAALETLKADPNLSQERKAKRLKWLGSDEKKPQQRSSFARWISDFFTMIGQLSRYLVWIICAVLALVLATFLYRLLKKVDVSDLKKEIHVPTHVRDLDIRPESLPDDIGAAALERWEQGDHRGALALLYRGLLSRLVHVHRVPIRDSMTEGDCLALASTHLREDRRPYVSRLIRVWQRATYGGRDPQIDEVRTLCADFAGALAPAATVTST